MSIKKYLFWSLLLASTRLFSQDTLNLDDAIKTALENNFDIQIASKDVAVAKNDVNIGNAGMLPSVSVAAGYNESSSDSRTELASGQVIEGSAAASSNSNASVSLSYTLFDGFAMFCNYKILKSQYALSELQAKSIIQSAILNLINLYYTAARLQQNYTIANESVKLSNERVERMKNLSALGAASKLDLLNAQVDFNSDKASLQQVQLDLENAKRNLNYAMVKNLEDNFFLSQKIQINEALMLAELKSNLETANIDIQMAKQNQQLNNLNLKLTRSGRFPVLALGSDYGIAESRNDAGFTNYSQSTGFSAGLTLSYSIFNGFRLNNGIQDAKISIEKSNLQYDQTVKQAETNLLNAFATYQNKLNTLKLEKENVSTAELNFKKSKDMYDLGQLTSTQLREAQLNLVKAKARISDAAYTTKIAEAELLQLSGQLVK